MAFVLNDDAAILADGDVTLPPKLERCVESLLKKKTFMPKADAKRRKSSAYAICTASTKNEALVAQILKDLPPYVECDLSDEGELILQEVEDFDFAKFDEQDDKCGGGCKECGGCSADLHEAQIFFSDEEDDKSKEVFSSFTRVKLAEKGSPKSKKVTRCGPDGEEKEYTNVPIEMLREGVFRHPWFGDLVIDRKMMTSMMQNFLNDILERELALDVSHEPDKGAYGWLRGLKLKRRDFGNGKGKRNVLVGTFDLNERGEEMILKEIFKYFSIEYHRNYAEREKTAKEIAEDKKRTPEERDKARYEGTDKGKEYGPTIFGGALTNRPFIPSMDSVKMSEGATDGEGEPTGTVSHESPQKTTDGDDVEEPQVNNDGGDDTQMEDDGTKAAEGCKSSDERDNDNEIKNAAAEKKARPPDSKLPEAAFALVKRDRSGTVIKRSLPHHGPNVKSPGENSSVDKGRLRNALARWNQVSGFDANQKARALRHLETHAKALLPSYKKKTKASGGGTMFEDRIAELKDQLDGMEDQSTELAQKVRDEIAFLEKAQADHEAKLNETKSQISDEMTAKLSEQQSLIEKLTERDKAREAKLAEITEKNRRTEVELYCDNLGQSKYPPAVIKAVRNVLIGEVQQYTEGGPVVTFSEEVDGKDEKREFSLRSAVEYIVASIPESHKVDDETTIEHNEDDEPETGGENGKLKLKDGSEHDLLDDAAIKASIGRAGFKTQEDPQ